MDTTPNLGLPYLAAAQSQKHVTHNEAIRALDALVQLTVASRIQTAPPATSPLADGTRYIVAANPTGVWAGHGTEIAAWQDGAWAFYPARLGWLVWVADEAALVAFDGAHWAAATGLPNVNPVALVGVNATADAGNRLAVKSPASLFDNVGNGHQVKVNKATAADTASILFQAGYSGRAEVGLCGDDNLHVKVSPDGIAWNEAFVVDRTSGAVAFPHTTFAPPYTLPPASGASLGGVKAGANLAVDADGTLSAPTAPPLAARTFANLTFPVPAGGTTYFVADAPGGPSLAVSDGTSYRMTTLATQYTSSLTQRNPLATDDGTKGYLAGDTWVNTISGAMYSATSVSTGAAIWALLSAPSLPLDTITGAAAAYGVFRLRSAYTGNCFQVRRASDNTTLDVGFDSAGVANWASATAFGSGTQLFLTKWYDQSGNGLDTTTPATANQPPLYFNKIGKLTALDFASSTWAVLPAGLALNSTAMSLALVAKQNSPHVGYRLQLGPSTLAGATSVLFGTYDTGQVLAFTSVGDRASARWHTGESVWVAALNTDVAVSIDDRLNAATGSTHTSVAMTGGFIPNSGSFLFNGQYGAAIFYASTLTTTQMQSLRRSLMVAFGFAPQVRDRLVTIGDSITQGAGAAANDGFTARVPALLTRKFQLCAMGVAGEQQSTETAGTYTPYVVSGAFNVAHVFSGTNDFAQGNLSTATLQTSTQALCVALRSGGFNKIIVGTMLPRTGGFTAPMVSATFETQRLAYNTWLRANYATFADTLADYGADAIMGNVANCTNTAYYADQTHPASGGHAILASICAAAVNRVAS